MGWIRLQISQRREITSIAVSIVMEKNTKTASRLIVRVARHLAEAGGFAMADRSRADMFLGDGAENGRMKIVANPAGSYGGGSPAKSPCNAS
jgi:hypothetical protein